MVHHCIHTQDQDYLRSEIDDRFSDYGFYAEDSVFGSIFFLVCSVSLSMLIRLLRFYFWSSVRNFKFIPCFTHLMTGRPEFLAKTLYSKNMMHISYHQISISILRYTFLREKLCTSIIQLACSTVNSISGDCCGYFFSLRHISFIHVLMLYRKVCLSACPIRPLYLELL